MTIQQAITTHYEHLHSRALRLTGGDEAAACDLVQATALRAMERADQYDPERASARRWLFGILRNLFLAEVRRGRVFREKVVPAVTRTLRNADMLPAARIEAHAYRGKVAAALAKLSEGERAAVLMHEVEGRTYREVAAALDVSLGTARNWIVRGREKIARSLETKTRARA